MTEDPVRDDEPSNKRDLALVNAALRDAAKIEMEGSSVLSLDDEQSDLDRTSPDRFPGYEITNEIHHGAQGVVYRAVQKGTKRQVAIKVLRRGPLARGRARMRFDLEIRILAQLDHPNIVTVYDSSATSDCFYYVMDYIAGEPLDQYAALHCRSVREALVLFGTICDAISAAHLRGVIHRDLKPGNIRVDADGHPHVLDFGIAKLIGRDTDEFSDAYPTSETGHFVGTLPWASPEQLKGSPGGIDLRTDVYSLGVILYRMLTGQFPHEVVGNMPDVLDHVLHAEPVRPSALRPEINDEVETIVLKCLAKERERRYQSAGELARDINRYLSGEPIEAKRDSAWYVFRKSVRRYKLPLAIAASFVLLLSSSTVALSIMYARQSRARRGEAEQRQLAEANQARAQQEAAKAQQATRFLQQMLSGIDPEVAGDLDKTLMRMILDKAAAKIETELAGQPEVEASIRATIGSTYQAIGEYPLARAHLEQALEIRTRVLGEEHPDTLGSMNDVAVLYHEQGRYTEAEPLLLRALEIDERVLGREHADTLKTMNNLGSLYYDQGRYAEAEPLLFRALEINERVLGAEHPATLDSLNNLGLLYYDQGRYGEAERLLARALENRQRVLGAEHPDTLKTMNNLGLLYLDQGRYDEAEPPLVDVLEIRQRVLGEEHPHTLLSMNNLAPLYARQGRYDEAEPLYVRALEVERRVLGEEHPGTLSSINNLAALYHDQGRYDEAEPLRVRLLEICKRVLGEEHPNTLISMSNLASLYRAQGRHDQAEPLLVQVLEVRKRVLGEEHPSTLASTNRLGNLHAAMGRLDEAEPLLAAAVDGARRSLPEGHPSVGDYLTDYGVCLTRLERCDEAETALLEAHQTLTAALGPAHKKTIKSLRSLVALYEAWNKPDLAAEWQAKLDAAGPRGPSENGR